jgi:Fuc2NAc and GlcNAc transferase
VSGLALLIIAIGSTAAGALLTWAALKHALAQGMLDVPNDRSSHVQATPRGGGVAIAIICLVGALMTAAAGQVAWGIALILVGAGAVVAAIGYLDDRRGMSRRVRFLLHVLASAASVLIIVGASHWALLVAAVLAVSWAINLFNFMDGIDGLAGSQALFVAGASAVLAWLGDRTDAAVLPALTAGACCGFLVWNRPPARIFMGDVGSGFLGLWLAALALLLSQQGVVSIWTSTILGSAFIADATTTLVRRALSGRRWYEAHRSHAYQNLARRWSSHARVTTLLWFLNVLIVTPLALLAHRYPNAAPLLSVVSCAIFVALAIVGRAGVEEPPAAQ